ncbi:MAG TPA: hypothetical protein VJ773_05090 [Gemmatimonadales bacterium]|nr:hypothetical protein [Gemmatimonadales bacterium]
MLGIFEHVWAARFPTRHRRAHLVVKVRGRRTEIGMHVLRIRFLGEDGTPLLQHEGTVRFGEPPAGIQQVEATAVLVFDLPLPAAGRYAFEVALDGGADPVRIPLSASPVPRRPAAGG